MLSLEILVSNSTSVSVGDTTLLVCMSFSSRGAAVSWTFNDQPLANTSLLAIYNQRLSNNGRDYWVSFLELCAVGPARAGNYVCTSRDGLVTLTATIPLEVIG